MPRIAVVAAAPAGYSVAAREAVLVAAEVDSVAFPAAEPGTAAGLAGIAAGAAAAASIVAEPVVARIAEGTVAGVVPVGIVVAVASTVVAAPAAGHIAAVRLVHCNMFGAEPLVVVADTAAADAAAVALQRSRVPAGNRTGTPSLTAAHRGRNGGRPN